MAKQRRLLDHLAQLYPEIARERLFAQILCGDALVEGERLRDPKQTVPLDAEVLLDAKRFVSRGGYKLQAALEAWKVPVADRIWVDAGASTGGFTDALLQAGAKLVHAVDVGTNQLDWSLRQNERVRVHEQTNIMDVTRLEPRPWGATADLSFRSLKGAAAHLLALTEGNFLVALIKPQFEWENPPPDFAGIVPPEAIEMIVSTLVNRLAEEGVRVRQVLPSPVRGRKGNQELLAWLEAESWSESLQGT